MDLTTLQSLEAELVNQVMNRWIALEYEFWWMWGALCGFGMALFAVFRISVIGVIGFVLAALAAVTQPLLYIVLPEISIQQWDTAYALPQSHMKAYALGLLITLPATFLGLRYWLDLWDRIKQRLVKKTHLAREGLTDIRQITRDLPLAIKPYSVERHFKNRASVFFGLNRNGRPVYLPQKLWRASHVDIVGTTGCGKGVLAGMLLTQAARQGESVVVVDPKNDEYLPLVLAAAAESAKMPFYSINLVDEAPFWNPFHQKTFFEMEELLAAGFSLSESGSEADFYRVYDRKAARAFAATYLKNPQPLAMAAQSFLTANPELAKKSAKFCEDLEELVSLPVINCKKGIDLADALQKGAVIYVRGSMRNPRILKLQRMLVLSVMQHCENRERHNARHVCIFLDEFKYLISKPALEALGAIRDKRAHVMIAHQSFGDLRDCPKKTLIPMLLWHLLPKTAGSKSPTRSTIQTPLTRSPA